MFRNIDWKPVKKTMQDWMGEIIRRKKLKAGAGVGLYCLQWISGLWDYSTNCLDDKGLVHERSPLSRQTKASLLCFLSEDSLFSKTILNDSFSKRDDQLFDLR